MRGADFFPWQGGETGHRIDRARGVRKPGNFVFFFVAAYRMDFIWFIDVYIKYIHTYIYTIYGVY